MTKAVKSAKPKATATRAGRERLIAAALRVAARDGVSLASLGLRELAREAGLNHNTFYRHFNEPADLGRAVAETIATQLMAGMKQVRQQANRHADATQGAVDYFFDFARANPEVIIVGLRELHGAASPMRAILQGVLNAIATESVEQIETFGLIPGATRETLRPVTLDITYLMFYRALDALERPRQRKLIAAQLVQTIRRQFIGAMAMQERES